jgi:hypothetical protein
VGIDLYSKWFEAKDVLDHTAFIDVEFLEVEITCHYGIPYFLLINNGEGWAQNLKIYIRCTMGLFVNI